MNWWGHAIAPINIQQKEVSRAVNIGCAMLALTRDMNETERRDAMIQFATELLADVKGELFVIAIA